jgi:ribonucleoside-triphosphate reductase
MHDLRFFFQGGLDLEKIDVSRSSFSPPQSLESALSMVLNVALHSAKEMDGMQTLSYFNVFLSPFIRGLDSIRVKETLRLFIIDVSQHANVSLNIELSVPKFIAEKNAYGFCGKSVYGDFVSECKLLASLIIEILAEESSVKPLFSPKLVINLRPETLEDEYAKATILKAHQLASERGLPYFANLFEKSQEQSVFSASGYKLSADLNGDWETETLRTGCLGFVSVNLPRIVYECEADENRFFEILKERFEMAARALEIKYRAIKQHGKSLLPFIMQDADGDPYFRPENCSRIINLVGLKEAAEALNLNGEQFLEFVDSITETFSMFTRKIGTKYGKRLFSALLPCVEASERFAQLDIERYGIGKVKFSGTREKPFYTSIIKLNIEDGEPPQNFLAEQHKLCNLAFGGSLTLLELKEAYEPEKLMSLTNRIVFENAAGLFFYNRKLTYCKNCKRSWPNLLHKCPQCGSINTLAYFSRFEQA